MARSVTAPRRPTGRTRNRTSGQQLPARLRWLSLLVGVFGLIIVAVVALGNGFTRPTTGSRSGGGAGPLSVLNTNDFHALAFSPADPNVIYFGHHNGIMRSEDAGRTWAPLVDKPGFDAMGLAINPANPRQLYLAGHDIFLASADAGATWQPVIHNLPGTDIHGFAASPADPNRLYAFVVGHGVFATADGGRMWQRLETAPADVTALAAAGGTPEVLSLASVSSGVLRSADGGRTWTPAAAVPDSRRVLSLAVEPGAPQIVYAGTDTGLFKSTDGGAAWTKLPYPGKNALALAVSPAQPKRLMAISVNHGDGEVYRSDDAGQTWHSRQ